MTGKDDAEIRLAADGQVGAAATSLDALISLKTEFTDTVGDARCRVAATAPALAPPPLPLPLPLPLPPSPGAGSAQ